MPKHGAVWGSGHGEGGDLGGQEGAVKVEDPTQGFAFVLTGGGGWRDARQKG